MMNAFTRLIMRPGVIILVVALVCLAAAACIKAQRLWQWKMALLAQEFGHLLALLAIAAAVLSWMVSEGRSKYALSLLGLAMAAILLLPAIGAARLTPGLQWARLWMPWVHSHPPVVIEKSEFWRQDSDALDLIVYRPSAPSKNLPCILVVHGGGWDGGTADEFSAWNEELASHGLLVLAMNYRLAPEHRWPAQRDDVRHAFEWARHHADELGIDTGRMVMMGRSAGGQIAAACAYGLPDLKVAGCILFYAPVDMEFARRFAFEDDILNSLKLLRQYLGGDPDQAGDNYHSASAIYFVTSASPPALLLHGTNDSLVWVKQSQRMAGRLDEAGVPHRYIELPWATHGCDYFPWTPDGQLSMHAVLDFVAGLKR